MVGREGGTRSRYGQRILSSCQPFDNQCIKFAVLARISYVKLRLTPVSLYIRRLIWFFVVAIELADGGDPRKGVHRGITNQTIQKLG